jgi:hypothetical protein
MVKKTEREVIKGQILRRMWKGEYLTNCYRGLFSEIGARKFFKRLENEGLILFEILEAHKKKVVFTSRGIEYLKEKGILTKDYNSNFQNNKNLYF